MTIEDAMAKFFSLLPSWTDDRHKAIIAIAFASGAYTAATLAVEGSPKHTKDEAYAICKRLEAAFDSIGNVH